VNKRKEGSGVALLLSVFSQLTVYACL